MKAPPVDYVRPRSLTEALDLLTKAGAEGYCIAMILDDEKLRQTCDVDQQPWRSNAQVHHREQRLPAGDHARLDRGMCQEIDCLCKSARPHIINSRSFHRGLIFRNDRRTAPPAGTAVNR